MTLSYISNAHPAYIDALYQNYQADPESVEIGWRRFFEGFEYAQSVGGNGTAAMPSATMNDKEFNVLGLIHGYRDRGHLLATTNPLKPRKERYPHLDLSDYGLSEADLDTRFAVGNELGLGVATLRDIVARLKAVYSGNIGFEYDHIEDRDRRYWLRDRIERLSGGDYGFPLDKKRRILEKLNEAVCFESFLAKKFIGQKRFGLEGGECTIAGLDAAILRGAEMGVKEVVIGMAHRGRLNVLANIMRKTYGYIFNEFEGTMVPDLSFGDGDVKYHLGYSSQVTTPGGHFVDLKLVPNPSHLEAVNPVVEGFARAKADILYAGDYDKILPVLIHGDAAVAGQGVVYETVQMSKLDGYTTGGTLHFVINNQVGFTTDIEDARSATYCTDVAKIVQAPVFHVNGDDPEALVLAIELAVEYRQLFNNDVFVDMVCYRKNGHNESDDPQFTQPQLYDLIRKHKDPRTIYSERLIARGEIEGEMAKQMEREFNQMLQDRLDAVRQTPLAYNYQESEEAWRKLKKKTTPEDYEQSPETAIPLEQVRSILNKLQELPKDFTPLPKFKDRILTGVQSYIDKGLCDWAMGEHLAYGSILLEGKDVRMSGQDVKRGTFSHRNAVLYDAATNAQFNRLDHLVEQQGRFRIYNSLLSEFAVMGFEFGYSLANPDTLVVWEAQFGDFANGSQTMIDQFLSASESKWLRMSGLVLLLPHGYEGQGPEHSSARLERFLQLCAEFNMTVANVTTPANFFHLIRRQLARPFRKPLVVMSPKKLLRFEHCVSPFEDFAKGGFQELFDDPRFPTKAKAAKVKKIVLCSGKFYYDLLEKQLADQRDDVAVVRLEQLYPLPSAQLKAVFEKYPKAQVCWAQEEPSNMGAWQYICTIFRTLGVELSVVARKASASPATGFKKVHDAEQVDLVERALKV
jgi:2-oxoglutarate dehydrogenase E1 component